MDVFLLEGTIIHANSMHEVPFSINTTSNFDTAIALVWFDIFGYYLSQNVYRALSYAMVSKTEF